MKRQAILAVLLLCGEAILIAIFVGIAIGIIGIWRQWETLANYSNGFFIAGCFLIIAGAFSRQNAGEDWSTFSKIGSNAFGDMSPVERANFLVDASSSFRLVMLGFLSGILLIIISVLIW